MSPRPYQRDRRQAAAEQTRARILTAARALLTAEDGFSGFSIDAVARRADVARVTVYYQFGSRAGLLEALSDDLAARGGMEHLAEAFQQPDAHVALDAFIARFGQFWTADRLVTRRLRALAALDPEGARVIMARDERRREGLRVLVRRLAAQSTLLNAANVEQNVEQLAGVLHMLTSFETFDTLAGRDRAPGEVIPLVQRLARAAVALHGLPG